MNSVPFSIYYAGDAYSTANKIMGRQSAGKSFMRGVARTWPGHTLHGCGHGQSTAQTMKAQLAQGGHHGELHWQEQGNWPALAQVGCLYYPGPPVKDLAFSRNAFNPAAFSMMGVTFTLSSAGAMDLVADLVLPPFQPWDAMICISQAALDFSKAVHAEMRDWLTSQTGASRFNTPQLPVIPLGVDCPAFAPQPQRRQQARNALELSDDEVVFLFAGRLSFHAKGNPAAMYQALEQAARHARVVCIEAGVFPNEHVRNAFLAAQRALAPSVRFIHVEGSDEQRYQQAWQAADAFVSLSDNVQETFGLTPVEAMAAGLPVVASDWNGYKETVRDGLDGFRIPTILPPAGCGDDLAMRHAIGTDSYDIYIGRTSLATVVDPAALAAALIRLASEPALRQAMGASGLAHAQATFDWPVILRQYADLADQLAVLRQAAGPQPAQRWVARADPFARFAHFSSATLRGDWIVSPQPDAQGRLRELLQLSMANFAFAPGVSPQEALPQLLGAAATLSAPTVNQVLEAAQLTTAQGARALMWLWKFDIVRIHPA